MKYLCLIYDEGSQMNAMSKSASDAFMGENMIAARIPSARTGSVEVRPVMVFDQQ